jgi:hypothetical protein
MTFYTGSPAHMLGCSFLKEGIESRDAGLGLGFLKRRNSFLKEGMPG